MVGSFTRRIAFQSFLRRGRQTLFSHFTVGLRISDASSLVLLRQHVRFATIRRVTNFRVFRTAAQGNRMRIFVGAWQDTVEVAGPGQFENRLFACFR